MLFLGAWQRHLLEKMGYNRGILYSLQIPPSILFNRIFLCTIACSLCMFIIFSVCFLYFISLPPQFAFLCRLLEVSGEGS